MRTKECKHKFQPRYDFIFPRSSSFSLSGNERSVIDAMKEKIYIYDICVKCGKIIKRE